MYKQMRQRLAIRFTGAVMAGTLLIGALPVAADDTTIEPHDVNVGAEATGMAGESLLTINSVVTPATLSFDSAAPSGQMSIVETHDDRSS